MNAKLAATMEAKKFKEVRIVASSYLEKKPEIVCALPKREQQDFYALVYSTCPPPQSGK
jgi:hypothetical protein